MSYTIVNRRPHEDTGVLTPPLFLLPLPNGIPSRGISALTCLQFKCYSSTVPLEIILEYYDTDCTTVTGYKLRKGGWTSGKKDVRWLNNSVRGLFGIHRWDGSTQDVYLCEGETDAMALSQHLEFAERTGLTLAYGGTPPPELLDEWLSTIRCILGENGTLYTCFDNDKDGQRYQAVLDRALPNHHILLPDGVKDVAELLLSGGVPEWVAYTPPSFILQGAALKLTHQEATRAYISTGSTELDHFIGGYAPGKFILLAAEPKQGKTAFVTWLITQFIKAGNGRVLYIPLELDVHESMRVLGAANLGKMLSDCTPEDLIASTEELIPNLAVMRHFGYMDIDTFAEALDTIPLLGISLVVIDHFTALSTSYSQGQTTQLLDAALSLFQAKLNEYAIPGIGVTHVNSSGGGAAILTPSSLRGSKALAQLPSTVLGIRILEGGLSEVYTIVRDRFVGRMGAVTYAYNGDYEQMSRKTGDW